MIETLATDNLAVTGASTVMLFGAGGFGLVIGWFVYFVNRYRKDDVQLSDIVTLIGAIGGAAVLSLFEAKTELFGAYGIGLALGFFGYFLALLVLVRASVRRNGAFTWEWFLDGRRKDPEAGSGYGAGANRAMGLRPADDNIR